MQEKLSKGAQTRERMCQKALRFIAKKGFQNTSLQSIAEGCQLSQSAVLYHFKTKENLLLSVLQLIISSNQNKVRALLSPEDSALERLQKHFEGNLEWVIAFPQEAQVILLLYYYGAFHPKFAGFYAQIREAARGRIEEIILAGQREKLFRKSLDAKQSAQALHDLLLGSLVNAVAVPPEKRELSKMSAKWNSLFKHYLIES